MRCTSLLQMCLIWKLCMPPPSPQLQSLIRLSPCVSVRRMTADNFSCDVRKAFQRELVIQGRVPSMAGELLQSGRMRRATC